MHEGSMSRCAAHSLRLSSVSDRRRGFGVRRQMGVVCNSLPQAPFVSDTKGLYMQDVRLRAVPSPCPPEVNGAAAAVDGADAGNSAAAATTASKNATRVAERVLALQPAVEQDLRGEPASSSPEDPRSGPSMGGAP
eukprot:scaffold25421_cov71-Phaeocystis_antarctica.AAC.5